MDSFVFWSLSKEEVFQKLQTGAHGLSQQEAKKRLEQYGYNLLKIRKSSTPIFLFLSQFKSPLVLLLLFAAVLSFILGDRTDSTIILVIVFLSSILGFIQEKGAQDAVEALLKIVQVKANVIRDEKEVEVPLEEVVPGDIVVLRAGDIIPGDCFIIESKDLFVDEAALTGETFAAEKKEGIVDANAPLSKRSNSVFMGSSVVTGSAKVVVVATGKETVFGKISEKLKYSSPETAFELGVRHFGYLLMEITLLLVIAIFAINIFLHRPVLQSFLFALALAVGLTPQLLPAIITVNLSHGAKNLAKKNVIVKRLISIVNFGSMDVLCVDKTGTLTKGTVELESAVDYQGNNSEKAHLYASLNAIFQTGYANPIDQAILNTPHEDVSSWKKVDEWPFDFMRKRISILARNNGTHCLITKGALPSLLSICTQTEDQSGKIVPISTVQEQINQSFTKFSEEGFRTIGVAYRDLGSNSTLSKEHEGEMIFLGFLQFLDPPKEDVAKTIQDMQALGISLKIITGDNELITKHVAKQVGLCESGLLTGHDLMHMSNEALLRQVSRTQIFAEVDPNQKERIIFALKKAKHTVGYLGDGINDASALHASDVGISVDSAADVAKSAADIILLKKDLSVLIAGVQEGRKTFANTLKYVFMATSANFGNMFSMAGVSLLINFLPLLPKQILLTNLLTDCPEMTIATDRVDPETLTKPVKWDLKFIRHFMIVFGLISSIFDFITFGVLLYFYHASIDEFRTGWFMESVISASVIVLVVRTRRSLFKSAPSRYLGSAVLGICLFTLFLPFLPMAHLFGFIPLPLSFYFMIGGIVCAYVLSVEIAKAIFYKKISS